MEKRSKIEYIINEEKRTVVAIMRDCKNDACRLFARDVEKIYGTEFWYPLHSLDYKINDTYRGKAHCSEDDAWDVEEGKRIARNRMLFKYYRARYKALEKIYEDWGKVFSSLGDRVSYAAIKLSRADDCIL